MQQTQKQQIINLNKKISNTIAAITKLQSAQWNTIISTKPTLNILVIHFGIGDNQDYYILNAFIQRITQCFNLVLFPGYNFGMIEFQKLEDSMLFMEQINDQGLDQQQKYINIEFGSIQRSVFFYFSQLQSNQIKIQDVDIPNAEINHSIPGLFLIENFINVEEETKIIEKIDKSQNVITLKLMPNQQIEQHNNNKHDQLLNTEYFNKISQRCSSIFKDDQIIFDQVQINNLMPGQGINAQYINHNNIAEYILIINLINSIVINFKSPQGTDHNLHVPPRSLVVLSGEVRYCWTHSIPARKLDRIDSKLQNRKRNIQLTFQSSMNNKCECNYPLYCQDQGYDIINIINKQENNNQNKENQKIQYQRTLTYRDGQFIIDYQQIQKNQNQYIVDQQESNDLKAGEIENKYVYQIYDKIAQHFNHTRQMPWPKVQEFLNSIPSDSIVGDIGCGNGKYLEINKSLNMIGTDRSINFLEICKEKYQNSQLFAADSLHLPLRTNSLDYVISIAVIHHFSTFQLRIQAIKELVRVTRSGGKILIYVWAQEQDQNQKNIESQDRLIPWNLNYKFEDNFEQQTETCENIDLNKLSVIYKRYYHMFKQNELEQLLENVQGIEIEKSLFDYGNWAVTIIKL